MIMLRRWVLTGCGFSPGVASLLALRSFLISAMGFLVSPRWNLLRARAVKRVTRSSVDMSSSASRSTPRKLNFLNVRFFFAAAPIWAGFTRTSSDSISACKR
ncbi:unnamed protein product [Linum tenue]|uniref:Secreted protein n=1 Tax=Linum tenue TaxID=586396 RepID=A0AAV0RY54_9ROSI|nr:unnamed protein product [Linum tenue]